MVVEGDQQRTRVELATTPGPAKRREKTQFLERRIGTAPAPFSSAQAEYYVGGATWSEQGMQVMLEVNEWERTKLEVYYGPKPPGPPPDLGPGEPGVFAFRGRASIFGHNAPLYAQLPQAVKDAYPKSWDDPATHVDVTTDSQGESLGDTTIRLDTTYRVAPDGWVILTFGTPDQGKAYRVAQATEPSLADFALSTKVTRLALKTVAGDDPDDLIGFVPRATSVHLGSERVELAEVPLPPTIAAGGTTLDLDRLVLGLAVGQPLALTGERADLVGITSTEIVTLVAVEHAGGRTTLTFGALQHPYVRQIRGAQREHRPGQPRRDRRPGGPRQRHRPARAAVPAAPAAGDAPDRPDRHRRGQLARRPGGRRALDRDRVLRRWRAGRRVVRHAP